MKKVNDFVLKVLKDNKLYIALLAVVMFFSRLGTWLYPFDSDHWIFYYVGRKWAQGGTMYVSAFDHKPPLIFVWNGLMHVLFGGNLVYHRAFLTLFVILDIYLFYKLLQLVVPYFELKNPELAIRISLLGYVFLRNLSQITSSGNNTENLGIIFLILMLINFIKYLNDKKLLNLFYGGISLSFLFFLKGNFLLFAAPIGLILLVENYKNIKDLFIKCFVFGAPLLVQSLFWVGYFKSKNALYDFLVATFLFSAKYSKTAWNGAVSNNPGLLLAVIIFLIPFLYFIYEFIKNEWKNANSINILLFFSLLVSLFIGFGVGQAYPYYFLITLPIFMLIATSQFDTVARLKPVLRYLLYFVILASFATSYAISAKQAYNSFYGSTKRELNEYTEIADYVDSHSNKDDKVFSYDYGAMFYRLANRDSGSRYISASILLLDYRENFGFKMDDTFIREMRASKAKFVVLAKDKNNIYYENKPVVDFFNSDYKVEKEYPHFLLLKIK